MAIQNEPTRIQIPFADSGTKNVIPDTNSTPSASQAASWTDGFPAQCSLPLSAGGIPPARADFNGLFNTMTQSERFTQEGGVWAWDATVDYAANRLVLGSDGLLYWSVAQSGPNVGGAQDPTADDGTYWIAPNVKLMDAGDSSNAAASTGWVNSWFSSQKSISAYYIDPTSGDDTNAGIDAALPLKTLSGLYSKLDAAAFSSSSIDVYLAAGSYGANLNLTRSSPAIKFHGPSSGVAEFLGGSFDSSVTASLYGRFRFTKNVNVSRNSIVILQDGCYINFNNLGNIAHSFYAYQNATIVFNYQCNVTLEYTGTTSFVYGNFETVTGGQIIMNGSYTTITSSGSLTGKRYSCKEGSGISNSGSTTKIPGSVAGTIDSTSYYS